MSKNPLILRVKIKFYIFPSEYGNEVNDRLYKIYFYFLWSEHKFGYKAFQLYIIYFYYFLQPEQRQERRFKMLKFNVKRVGELLDNEGLWLNQCGNLFSVPGFGEIIDVRYDCPEEELGCIITFADGFEMDFDEQFAN